MNSSERGTPTLGGVKDVLSILNSLHVGELGRLTADMERARQLLAELGQAELEERIREAQVALRQGDMKEFRRALANVTAKLGHLR